ncbi:MAG: C10 family peptidase, partial [Draconibacterium sp.]
MDTEWGQGSPFNISCPDDPSSGNKCLVGCTAVALGQILNYWNCRVFPDGANSYTPLGFSSPLSVNFYDQDYDWDAISSDVYARADLLYHCGVAIEVDYTDNLTT